MREDGQRESLRRRRARRRRRGPTHAHTSGRVCFERGEKKTWKKTCGIQNPEKAPELFLPPRLSAVGCDVSAGRRARTHPLRVPRRLSVSAIVSVTSLLRVATGCSGKGLAAASQGGFYTPATDRAVTPQPAGTQGRLGGDLLDGARGGRSVTMRRTFRVDTRSRPAGKEKKKKAGLAVM